MKIIALIPPSFYKDSYNLHPTLSYPDSAIVKNGNPVYIPDFDSSFSARIFLAVKISRLGKNVAERFASRYYSEATPALTIFADNLLSSLQADGLPWTAATGFDKSIVLGNFIPFSQMKDSGSLMLESSYDENIPLCIPDETEIAKAINEVSRYNSLKMGDLILIPIPSEPIPLRMDTLLTIKVGENQILKMPVK